MLYCELVLVLTLFNTDIINHEIDSATKKLAGLQIVTI